LIAIIIFAAVLTGAFFLVRKVFPSQIEKLPIIGMVGRSATPTPTPFIESDKKEAGDASNKETPAPSSLDDRQVEPSSPSPTSSSTSSKVETSSKSNTTVTNKTIYVVQPSPTPTTFKVTNLTINSSPANYAGSCPKDVTFYATITTNGAGSVTYRWVRSDGTETGENSISFDFASSKSVENTWSRSSSGWEKLKITSPTSFESSQATFNISCN
jgi:hypothetical protein